MARADGTARYRVVHKPRVAVRISPSTTADPAGLKFFGDEVDGTPITEETLTWLALDGGGYILIDGKSIGLGLLLEPLVATQPPTPPSSPPKTPPPKAAAKRKPATPAMPLPELNASQYYQVVHDPHVAARATPSRTATPLMVLKYGSIVRARPLRDDPTWVCLTHENDQPITSACYALVDGSALGFGTLLQLLEGMDLKPSLVTPVMSIAYAFAVKMELPLELASVLLKCDPGDHIEIRLRTPRTTAAQALRRVGVDEQARWLKASQEGRAAPIHVLVNGLPANTLLLVCVCIVSGGEVDASADGPVDASSSVRHVSRWCACATCVDPLDEAGADGLDLSHRKVDMLGFDRGGCSVEGSGCDQYLQLEVSLNSMDAFGCARCGCGVEKHDNKGLREEVSDGMGMRRNSSTDVMGMRRNLSHGNMRRIRSGLSMSSLASLSDGGSTTSLAETESPQTPTLPPMSMAEAERARAALFKRFEVACGHNLQYQDDALTGYQPWPQLAPIRKLWAVSDVHVEHDENWSWLKDLPPIFHEDGLIIAGDVCAGINVLRDALTMLVPQFRHVFYIVGNHELWLSRREPYDDSMEKLLAILELCKELGAHATPSIIREADGDGERAVAVCPLHAWYHDGFLDEATRAKAGQWEEDMRERFGPQPPASRTSAANHSDENHGDEEAKALAADEEARRERSRKRDEMRVATMDGMCKWPRCFTHIDGEESSTRELLCKFFARLNEPITAVAEAANANRSTRPFVVTYSHFLPHPRLHRGPVFMGEIEGSTFLGQQVAAIKPDVHVCGHTHYDLNTTIGGVRYIQKPLGYPKERDVARNTGEFKRIFIDTRCGSNSGMQWSESPPLALVWQSTLCD